MSLPFNLFGYDICIFTYMSCSYVYMKGSWAARKIWWIPLIEVAKSHDFTTIKLLSWNYLGWWSKLETLIAIHFISLMLFFEITWDYDTYWPIFRGWNCYNRSEKIEAWWSATQKWPCHTIPGFSSDVWSATKILVGLSGPFSTIA